MFLVVVALFSDSICQRGTLVGAGTWPWPFDERHFFSFCSYRFWSHCIDVNTFQSQLEATADAAYDIRDNYDSSRRL